MGIVAVSRVTKEGVWLRFSRSFFLPGILNPALNGSSEMRHFERSDAIEICNGIISDFYTGLIHIIYH